MDADLPLAGVPFAVKDNIDVAGLPTTAACPAFAYAPPSAARRRCARLLAAGAVLVGKTNLDQFATGLVGTRSPVRRRARRAPTPARDRGGSSSGSAVAVALGRRDLALGTDTAGSGRVPAAFNGIVGREADARAGQHRGRGAGLPVAGLRVGVRRATVADAGAGARGAGRRGPRRRRLGRGRAAGAAPRRPRASASRARARSTAARPAAAEALRGRGARLAAAAGRRLVEVDLDAVPGGRRGCSTAAPWVAERYAAVGDVRRRASRQVDPVVGATSSRGRRELQRGRRVPRARAAGRAAARRGRDVGRGRHAAAADGADPSDASPRWRPIRSASTRGSGTYTNVREPARPVRGGGPVRRAPDGLPFGVQLLAPAFHDTAVLDFAARWPVPDAEVELVGLRRAPARHAAQRPAAGARRALRARHRHRPALPARGAARRPSAPARASSAPAARRATDRRRGVARSAPPRSAGSRRPCRRR